MKIIQFTNEVFKRRIGITDMSNLPIGEIILPRKFKFSLEGTFADKPFKLEHKKWRAREYQFEMNGVEAELKRLPLRGMDISIENGPTLNLKYTKFFRQQFKITNSNGEEVAEINRISPWYKFNDVFELRWIARGDSDVEPQQALALCSFMLIVYNQ